MAKEDYQPRVDELKAAIIKLSRHLDTNRHSLSHIEVSSIIDKINTLKREYRVTRSKQSFLYFMYEYFSEDRNPGNDNNVIPAGITWKDAPNFHKELCNMLDNVAQNNPTAKLGWATPRGSAKTTYLSNGFPIYNVVLGLRRYILIISETGDMSEKFIEWISGQLKENEKLREDFGEKLHKSKTENEKDNNEQFVTTNGIMVRASAMGKQLRGSRYKAHRPDLVIMDDLESEKNTNTKELRDKNLHWYNKTITPIGDPSKTAFLYLGTLVHAQGLLPNVLGRTDYTSKIFSAVTSYPYAMDKWDIVLEMLRDPTDPERLDKAYEYYMDHQEEMDEGCELLWPGRYSYFDLMQIKADIGTRAFSSEYLNKPDADESRIFLREKMDFYDRKELFDEDGKPIKLSVYGFWDMALGKNKRSDYNAIVILGVERRTGIVYVLEAWGRKIPLHEAKKKVIEKIIQYKVDVFGVESNAFQHEVYKQIKEDLTKKRWYNTRIKPVNSTSKKESRIESLEPLFENGSIRLRQNQSLLIEMLEMYPTHDHDDLPDALAGAMNLVKQKTARRTFYQKPKGM